VSVAIDIPEMTAVAAPPDRPGAVIDFLRLSVALTGFDRLRLEGSGMVEPYYNELARIVGLREIGALLSAALDVVDASGADAGFEQRFTEEILDNPRYGPLARNIITMWYLGSWIQLPRAWRDAYGASSNDIDHVVSAAAYQEGLVWPAAGTHPMGAKQPGFASWAVASAIRPDGAGQ
jgi:hypothetical protein